MATVQTDQRATIKVQPETWQRINALKRPGDTIDSVLNRLLDERESAKEPPK